MTTSPNATCPECEAPLTLPALEAGETLGCPECLLTLRVENTTAAETTVPGRIHLTMVEPTLRDWGE
ncbi:lysine biosynthesis protein LysW [Streptomyces sp. ODS28]|uniref:lysine biosynthesis protein LysW n=1 Tax=Streptomyces sp. ODS28 TaxID=3136688 RepID=UPI0031EAE613